MKLPTDLCIIMQGSWPWLLDFSKLDGNPSCCMFVHSSLYCLIVYSGSCILLVAVSFRIYSVSRTMSQLQITTMFLNQSNSVKVLSANIQALSRLLPAFTLYGLAYCHDQWLASHQHAVTQPSSNMG